MSLNPEYIFASLLVGGVGFVLFSYGRKQRRIPHIGVGLTMLIYPYFVTNIPAMLGLVPLLLGTLWLLVRYGL